MPPGIPEKECPAAFCYSAQPKSRIFGAFSFYVKSGYRFFIAALHRHDAAAKGCLKALPPFCTAMVAAETPMQYNKAVPEENKKTPAGEIPALQSAGGIPRLD